MDWKQLSQKITPYIDRAKEYGKKAKEYGKKATEFTEKQIQITPLFLKNQAEYDAIIQDKRVIIIAYDNGDIATANTVRLFSPIWMSRAFMDTAKLRFISTKDVSDLVKNLGLKSPIDMRIRFEGSEVFQFSDIESIKKWWNNPIYITETAKTETHTEEVKAESTDPLAGK